MRDTDAKRTSCRRARALVVFSDVTTLRLLNGLRRGFRHCFVLIEDVFQDLPTDHQHLSTAPKSQWLLFDPMAHRFSLARIPNPSANPLTAADLALWLRRLGYRVVETMVADPDPSPRPAPVRPVTCVEAIKRVLGLRLPWVITPWSLYRSLKYN